MFFFAALDIIKMLKPVADVCNVYLIHKYRVAAVAVLVLGCKGVCARLETTGGGKLSAYGQGYKRCSACDVFIKTDSARCPCCKLPLRTKKRFG